MEEGNFYNFNPGLPEPLNVVHPLQLKAVRQLIESDIPEEVNAIFLFGGSLDLACSLFSDLDLYVLTEYFDQAVVYEKMHRICKTLKRRFDILVSSEAEFKESVGEFGTVESRLWNRGICIYAK